MDKGFNAAAMKSARETYRKFVSLPMPPNVFKVQDQTGSVRSKFPAQLGSTDPRDEQYALRSQLVNRETGVVDGVGLATADEDYFNYAQSKREDAMMFEFYTYIMSQADLSKPESSAWWFDKFPWMKDLRIAEIDRQSAIQNKLAKIQITGPQSEDDFMVMYLKQNNLLGDADVPVNKLNQATAATSFKAGMYSIFSKPANLLLAPFDADGNANGKITSTVDWGNPLGPGTNARSALPGFGFDKNPPGAAKAMLGV